MTTRLMQFSLQMLLTSCSATLAMAWFADWGCCGIRLITLELGLLPKFMLSKKLMLFLDLDDGTSQWPSFTFLYKFLWP